MTRSKKITPPQPEPSLEEIERSQLEIPEEEEVDLDGRPVQKLAVEKPKEMSEADKNMVLAVGEKEAKKIRRIAYFLHLVGLNLEESCKLAGMDQDYFKQLMNEYPIVRKAIEIKELEYKKDMLYTISNKARTGDEKLAQWLLERRYPEEFAASKKHGPISDKDFLFEAIEFIQKSSDRGGLVKETSGRALVVKRIPGSAPTVEDNVQTLENLLA